MNIPFSPPDITQDDIDAVCGGFEVRVDYNRAKNKGV